MQNIPAYRYMLNISLKVHKTYLLQVHTVGMCQAYLQVHTQKIPDAGTQKVAYRCSLVCFLGIETCQDNDDRAVTSSTQTM